MSDSLSFLLRRLGVDEATWSAQHAEQLRKLLRQQPPLSHQLENAVILAQNRLPSSTQSPLASVLVRHLQGYSPNGSDLLTFKADDSADHVLEQLSSRKVLSAPVYDGARCLGLVDMLDLVSCLLSLMESDSGSLFMMEALSRRGGHFSEKKAFQLVNFSRLNPYLPVSEEETLEKVLLSLSSGVRRLPILNAQGAITGMLSQSLVIRYLHSNPALLGPIANQTIAQMQLEPKPVVSVTARDPAIDAFRQLISEDLGSGSGVAIMDDSGNVLTHLGPSDLNGIGQFRLLLDPVERFKEYGVTRSHSEEVCYADETYLQIMDKMIQRGARVLYLVEQNSRQPKGAITMGVLMRALCRF